MANDTKKNLQENVTYIIFHYQQSVSQFTYTKQLYVCFTLSSSLYYIIELIIFFLKVESTPAGRMCTICCSASAPLHINKSHEKYFVVFCLKSLKFQNFLSNLMNMHAHSLACFFRSSIYFRNVLLFVFKLILRESLLSSSTCINF